MPNQCLGVIFENVAVRKQVDEMLKKHASELEQQKSDLHLQMSKLSKELIGGLKQIGGSVRQVKSSGKSRFTKKQLQSAGRFG